MCIDGWNDSAVNFTRQKCPLYSRHKFGMKNFRSSSLRRLKRWKCWTPEETRPQRREIPTQSFNRTSLLLSFTFSRPKLIWTKAAIINYIRLKLHIPVTNVDTMELLFPPLVDVNTRVCGLCRSHWVEKGFRWCKAISSTSTFIYHSKPYLHYKSNSLKLASHPLAWTKLFPLPLKMLF